MPADAEAVALVEHQVERHPDREVGADGRVHRDQRALGRLVERGLGTDHAVDDRFAVLGLADLEVGRLGGRLDEVAGGVDVEQARWLAGDLAAKNETGAELDAEGFKRVGIAQEHLAQGIADMAGGLEEIGHVHQRRSLAVARMDFCNIEVSDCVIARLPELRSTMARSPGFSKIVILRKVLIWSTPALVRESERRTTPSSRSMPMQ